MADRKPLEIDIFEIDREAGKHWLHPTRPGGAEATDAKPQPSEEPQTPNSDKKQKK